jgi:hypothetical protein
MTMNEAAGLPSDAIRIVTCVHIGRPPRDVFDYVSTPALWPTWHPATAAVREVPDRPLGCGETVVETSAFAGRRTDTRWTVVDCVPPSRWEIVTENPQGSARIVYQIDPAASGSMFQRTLMFRSARWPWRWLDSTLLRAVLVRQSARALANLQAVLEARTAVVPPLVST